MKQRYPLAAAEKLRAQELDLAKEALARATEAVTRAEEEERLAGERIVAHDQETAQVRERERDRTRVEDIHHARAYLTRRADERAKLAELHEEAIRALVLRRQEEELSRAQLADARAQKRAVEKHRERWEAEGQRADDLKRENEADDLNSSRFK